MNEICALLRLIIALASHSLVIWEECSTVQGENNRCVSNLKNIVHGYPFFSDMTECVCQFLLWEISALQVKSPGDRLNSPG